MNMRHPYVLQLIMDSLRYWVLEMHVDGFRFDLASALARELHAVDRLSTFFELIQQDPVVSQVKLIAEPWDVGEGGYQVGNFPPQWSEWNGKYRDCVRDFWRGEDQTLAELAYRFTGSSDLYGNTGRRPFASINFVTAHDGFTLRDLVSYNDKHNEANGEDNRDGESHNRSWNYGVEGETNDAADHDAARTPAEELPRDPASSRRACPCSLAGDEIGRTQRGNNNAYCQDNDVSWLDWRHRDEELLDFVRRLVAFRREHPVFQRRRWFQGLSIRGSDLSDIGWFKPDGEQMSEKDWNVSFARALGVYLNGEGITSRDQWGQKLVDDSYFVVLSAHHEHLDFRIPLALGEARWKTLFDTAANASQAEPPLLETGARIEVVGRSVRVLERVDP